MRNNMLTTACNFTTEPHLGVACVYILLGLVITLHVINISEPVEISYQICNIVYLSLLYWILLRKLFFRKRPYQSNCFQFHKYFMLLLRGKVSYNSYFCQAHLNIDTPPWSHSPQSLHYPQFLKSILQRSMIPYRGPP